MPPINGGTPGSEAGSDEEGNPVSAVASTQQQDGVINGNYDINLKYLKPFTNPGASKDVTYKPKTFLKNTSIQTIKTIRTPKNTATTFPILPVEMTPLKEILPLL